MALVSRKPLFEAVTPLVQIKRFKGKINIQRPRAPHFERAKYLAFTKPWYISPYKDKTPRELCKISEYNKVQETRNPLQEIIAREAYEMLVRSRLVGFYHLNPMNSEDRFKAQVMFHQENMFMKQLGKKTIEIAVRGTPYETILDFYVSQNTTVFSDEPKIKSLLKVTKKFPQLILLAAIYEGKLVSKDELIEYGNIPDLQAAQGGLVHTLNAAATTLVGQLNTHQSGLVSSLEQRAKQLEEETEK